ncbi:MAG: TIGR04168 family protein [Oscillatoriales cyanobacterium SM2_2_1]|nr:TIGR04168 family protein [Oscillatoriales cyanobacterium SM2_2_1]
MSKVITIAVIGDIHDQWLPEDHAMLHQLGVDLVLFVGDFGNEVVDLVRLLTSLDLPKACILGNHDAFYTASEWGRKKAPYDHCQEDRVQQQLDLLGPCHVGYGYSDFPQFQLSVVGARPFSWGGRNWKNPDFYRDRYGIETYEQSIDRILKMSRHGAFRTQIFLGHNGPSGLGDQQWSICGKDWQPVGGDHGDPDFAAALAAAQEQGIQVPLVTFGHMHHRLRHCDRPREMVVTNGQGTVFLNAAFVPRIQGGNHLFCLVSLAMPPQSQVLEIRLVTVSGDRQIGTPELLYPKTPSAPAIAVTE